MTIHEVTRVVSDMSDGLKYRMLLHHQKPKDFPVTNQAGCNRSVLPEWYVDRSWLAYSVELDGAFCIPCALFTKSDKRNQLRSLVNSPLQKWARVSSVIFNHGDKDYHKDAMTLAKGFITSIEKPLQGNVAVSMNTQRQANIKANRYILAHMVRATLYLGRQGAAFRGHNESPDQQSNKGNFRELIEVISTYSPELRLYLEKNRKTTYLSPQIQNELIGVIGHDIIRADVLDETREARYFSILGDESSSAKKEFLSLVIRFVDKDCQIREEFLCFNQVTKTSGQMLGERILQLVDSFGLDILKCRGQGYDGAAAMSSDRVGVQAVVRERAPKALYVHCSSHCLNLVITHSCKLPAIRKMIDKVAAVIHARLVLCILLETVSVASHAARLMFCQCFTHFALPFLLPVCPANQL